MNQGSHSKVAIGILCDPEEIIQCLGGLCSVLENQDDSNEEL